MLADGLSPRALMDHGAGLLGALASQFWFIAFALTTAANVRTLALVEVMEAEAGSLYALAADVLAARASPARSSGGWQR